MHTSLKRTLKCPQWRKFEIQLSPEFSKLTWLFGGGVYLYLYLYIISHHHEKDGGYMDGSKVRKKDDGGGNRC